MASNTNQSSFPESIYFLGAGFSVLAGVPIFRNFRDKAEYICKNKLLDDHQELFTQILKHWNNDFKDYNIEQYYAMIEIKEMLKNKKDKKKSKKYTDYLVKFINLTIQKSLELNQNSENIYSKFFGNIINSNAGVITTNWDTVLESPYNLQMYELSNTFIKDGSINYCNIRPYDDTKKIRTPVENCILKLHGSLNWGYCEKCKEIFYFDETSPFFTSDSEVECSSENCKGKKSKLQRFLIPPTLSKLAKATPSRLVSIWTKAYIYLKFCEKLYFIGYSIPETDVEMKFFISNALKENSNLKQITIVTKQKHLKSKLDFEECYLSILPRNIDLDQIEFCYDGFEKWYNRNYNHKNRT